MNLKNINYITAVSLITLAILTLPKQTFAFPLMVKHGYTTCITCHFSPSGGGLINSYGKFVSGELFGRYNTSEDALPFLTAPEEDKFFNAGILMRGAQTYLNTPTVKSGDFKRMQMDLEIVLSKGPYFAEFSGGLRGSSAALGKGQKETDLKTRTYYLGARDANYAVRAGRFFPEFGIRNPNHNVFTRRGVYWNQGDEPHLFQASYLTQEFSYTAAYLEGAPETSLTGKKGYLFSVDYKTGHTRTGVSYLNATEGVAKANATSVFTTIGYEEKLYILAEYVRKYDTNSTQLEVSDLSSSEIGYEFSKGIFPYLGVETKLLYSVGSNGVTGDIRTYYLPLGVKFYPYTHFEFVFQYARGIQASGGTNIGLENAFLMTNIYF